VDAPTNLQLPGTTTQLINFDNETCTNGSGTGKVPIIFAFQISCNTVFGELGMNTGSAAIQQQANKFGMNDPNLTIPMPVSPSQYPLITDKAHTAMSAIGQFNDTVTPLQEAMFAASIANNGTLMKPYLVQDVKAPDLTTIQQATPTVYQQAVSGTVAGQMKQMMIGVTAQGGTAFNSAGTQVVGTQLAAKTGTAQNGVNNAATDDAVFTCFTTSANRPIAVGVIVKGGGLGADASAPIAVQVIKAYLGLG
jgi:peptidoglycan glycosyltransferase